MSDRTPLSTAIFCAFMSGIVTLFPSQAWPAGSVCSGADLIVTTTPAPMQNVRAVERHLNLMLRAGARADVAVIGDSIAERWPTELLEVVFPGKTIINLGIGGDRTQSLLWRLKTGSYDRVDPSSVVMIVGTNNMLREAPCAVVAGVGLVLADLAARWPHARVYLFEVMPRGKPPELMAVKARERIVINDGIVGFAQKSKSVTAVNVDNVLVCPSGSECPDFLPDFLHPSISGYQHLADRLKSVVGSVK